MDKGQGNRSQLLTGLSARLLVLTVFFIMLSELFVYAPSIARYRLVYMQERIAAAHLASLALEAPSDNKVSDALMTELLDHARSYSIVLKRPQSKALMLAKDMPGKVQAAYDLGHAAFFPLIGEAFMTLGRGGSRLIRVIGPSSKDPGVLVETVIDEAPMRAEMYDYSKRILALSIAISLATAFLVYLSLHWLFVRPMVSLADSMQAFRQDPENVNSMVTPGQRRDEVGLAQRELAGMQAALRRALQQRAHLAALGTAVTKISHDLRNILATAQIISDGLAVSEDPNVKKAAPRLLAAIDRAVTLCSETLKFAHEGTPPPRRSRFDLERLVRDVEAALGEPGQRDVVVRVGFKAPFEISADHEQIFRVFLNLMVNACEAGADEIAVAARREAGQAVIEVSDNGPGLPPKARERLFEPFSGTGKAGGTGLGLAIARDLMRGHGGNVELASSTDAGATFRLTLPDDVGAAFPRTAR